MIEYNGRKVTVMACSSCNIKCQHCYISYTGNMTPEYLKQIVTKLSKRYQVEINGSEIMTNLDYLDSYPIVGQDFLMTNGLAIYQNPQLVQLLKEHGIKKIFMSYHFGIQDEISKVKIRQLEENIKNIHSHGLKIRLYTTITSSNYKLIHEIIEKAKDYGVYSIRFTNYIRQGNAFNMESNNMLNQNQLDYFFQELNYERTINDVETMKITRCGTFGKGNSNKFNCYAGINNVVLTPDNKIYPCIFLAKPGYEIGMYDGNIIQLNNIVNNSGDNCIAKEICNYNNAKVFKKTFGGVK